MIFLTQCQMINTKSKNIYKKKLRHNYTVLISSPYLPRGSSHVLWSNDNRIRCGQKFTRTLFFLINMYEKHKSPFLIKSNYQKYIESFARKETCASLQVVPMISPSNVVSLFIKKPKIKTN